MRCREYVVKEGDTLYSIARRAGTTVEEILEINKGIEPARLIAGTTLCLPLGGAIIQDPDEDLPQGLRPQNPQMDKVYVVVDGDTIASIAKSFGVSPEQLLFANPEINPGYIVAGTSMNIPKADLPLPGSVRYTVKAGEDVTDILRRLGIGYGRLRIFNPQRDLTKLEEGMVIFVPELYGGDVNSCEVGSYSYKVEKGDTKELIAEKFNLSVSSIKAEEPLREGTVICLPMPQFDDSM